MSAPEIDYADVDDSDLLRALTEHFATHRWVVVGSLNNELERAAHRTMTAFLHRVRAWDWEPVVVAGPYNPITGEHPVLRTVLAEVVARLGDFYAAPSDDELDAVSGLIDSMLDFIRAWDIKYETGGPRQVAPATEEAERGLLVLEVLNKNSAHLSQCDINGVVDVESMEDSARSVVDTVLATLARLERIRRIKPPHPWGECKPGNGGPWGSLSGTDSVNECLVCGRTVGK